MKAPKHRPAEPDFVTKSELAYHMGAETETIDEWIRRGIVPPPHTRLGERHAIWLRRYYNAYREHQTWPKEAWPESVR